MPANFIIKSNAAWAVVCAPAVQEVTLPEADGNANAMLLHAPVALESRGCGTSPFGE